MYNNNAAVFRGPLQTLAMALLMVGLALGSMSVAGAATIVIEVQAQGGDDSFAFSGDLGSFDVSSQGGQGQRMIEGLATGEYAVTGQAPTGWMLLAIMCHHPSASIDFATGSVRFDLSAEDSVSCTFIFRA